MDDGPVELAAELAGTEDDAADGTADCFCGCCTGRLVYCTPSMGDSSPSSSSSALIEAVDKAGAALDMAERSSFAFLGAGDASSVFMLSINRRLTPTEGFLSTPGAGLASPRALFLFASWDGVIRPSGADMIFLLASLPLGLMLIFLGNVVAILAACAETPAKVPTST